LNVLSRDIDLLLKLKTITALYSPGGRPLIFQLAISDALFLTNILTGRKVIVDRELLVELNILIRGVAFRGILPIFSTVMEKSIAWSFTAGEGITEKSLICASSIDWTLVLE
jgi:hypothetical protein